MAVLQPHERRTDPPISEFNKGSRRYFDAKENVTVVKICSGEWYVSTSGEMISTILGSCVSACIRDPIAGVGGMNHFLLPGEDRSGVPSGEGARYGSFAMEQLINAILKAGGRKERLEVKVFGGGNVINNTQRIGSKNAEFIRAYLARERLRLVSEDLEGDHPRRIQYFPATGRAMMLLLKRREDLCIVDMEAKYKSSLSTAPVDGAIELF